MFNFYDNVFVIIVFYSTFPVLIEFLISGATAADALSIGYRTILIDDCCRGVDLNDIEKTKNSVIKNHGVIVQSHEVNLKQKKIYHLPTGIHLNKIVFSFFFYMLSR